MEQTCVKDLMVPISEYATVKVGTSLLEATLALETAQEAFTTNKYQHRAILVLDDDNKVVGKIGQLRILKAVETRFDLESETENLSKFRFSEKYMARQMENARFQGPILTNEPLGAAAAKKVEEFMQKPTPGEFVDEESSLDIAIHKLVAGTHLSLLVTRNDEIVGILRIADVFAAVFHKMRATKVTPEM